MFCNVANYVKILKTANSCQTKDHIRTTFNWANKFRRNAKLTEFEYLEVEKILLEKMNLSTSLSSWNSTINLEECLKQSMIQ